MSLSSASLPLAFSTPCFFSLGSVPFPCPSNSPPPDYCVVAFFIVLVISTVQWFLDGRKNFKGPKVELVGEVPIHATEVDDAGGKAVGNGYANGEVGDEGEKL